MKFHFKLVVVCCLSIVSFGQAQNRALVKSGVLDARQWNFDKERLPLSGYWTFYSKTLLTETPANNDAGVEYLVPSLWNDNRTDGSGKGFGSYSLRILLPDSITQLSMEIPQLYSAYKLCINGKIVTEVGKVGTTKESSAPHWVYNVVNFSSDGEDTLDIVLQVSNYHHFKGGIKEQIHLGTVKKSTSHFTWIRISNIIESALLFLTGLTFVILFFLKDKKVSLYFGLFCITWAIRSVFSNLYLAVGWFPSLPWALVVRTEYIALYFGMIWSAVFLYYLFKNNGSNKMMTYILVTLNVMFVIFTLFASPAIFSKWISLYLAVAAMTVIYGAVMTIRALFFEHAGAWFLMASILTGVIMFGYDIIAYQTTLTYNYIFLNIGYIIMFLLIALGLLFNMNILKSKPSGNMLTYEEMFREKH
jgi:hypothetical protein